MLNITIPMWLLLTIAGLPNLLLVMIVLRLLRLRRSKKQSIAPDRQRPSATVSGAGFSGQLQQQILTQQIDAVFNALFTIIETERIKLKALVGHAYEREGQILGENFKLDNSEPEAYENIDEETASLTVSQIQENIRPTVVSMAQDGLTPDEIARHLSISRAEVALVLKMNAVRNGHVGRKMRAVA